MTTFSWFGECGRDKPAHEHTSDGGVAVRPGASRQIGAGPVIHLWSAADAGEAGVGDRGGIGQQVGCGESRSPEQPAVGSGDRLGSGTEQAVRPSLVLAQHLLWCAEVLQEPRLVGDRGEQVQPPLRRHGRAVTSADPVGGLVRLDPDDGILRRWRERQPVHEGAPALGRVGLEPGAVHRVGAPLFAGEQQVRSQAVAARDPWSARGRERLQVDAEIVEDVQGSRARWHVEEGPRSLAPGVRAVQVHGAAVAEHHDVRAGGGVAGVELVAMRVAAEVGQRIDEQDLGVRPEAIAIVLRSGESAHPGADDDEVV